MNYFDYTKNLDVERSLRIYHVVQGLSAYAKTIYKGYWSDALDKSFFHVLDNYDESSGGSLEHYAIKVVNTIMLGRFTHELAHDTSLEIEVDKKSIDVASSNPLHILIDREEEAYTNDLNACIQYLIPNFTQDYKFFMDKKPESRKCSYDKLFEKFSYTVVEKATNYLADKYGKEMEKLGEVRKTCKYRNFPKDRYLLSMETSIEYMGMFRGTLLYRSTNKRTVRHFYMLNIRKMLDYVVKRYYENEDSTSMIWIDGTGVYCTLSGQIVIGREELENILENEIIGATLARISTLKVVVYERGESIILSTAKEINLGMTINFLDGDYMLDLQRITAKRLSNLPSNGTEGD